MRYAANAAMVFYMAYECVDITSNSKDTI